MPQTYYLQNIRTLLTEGFSEDDLRTFCFDTSKFKPVHHELAQLTGKKAIVQHLLEFAERQECLDALLDWARTQNPVKYEKHQPYFEGDAAPTLAQLAELRAHYIAQIIDRHQDLDFVGIPELKERRSITIENIFIRLRAEREIEVEEPPYSLIEQDLDFDGTTGPAEAVNWLIIEHDMGRIGTRTRRIIKEQVNITEAMQESKRLVILGDPGAGKTTLLKYITLAFAQNRPDRLDLSDETRLPIFVRLYDYVAKRANHPGDYSLVDYLYTQVHENLLLDLPAGFFEAELEQGQCCVCLDGLDELGGAGLRREVSAAVASLASRYRGNRYLVTSRLVGYEEAPLDRRDFSHHTVLPFGEDDICRFVRQWYTAREKDPVLAKKQAESLTQTIMAQPPLKTLATNPLMLTIIALVHRIEAELPHERVKLYDKCVTALVETWEQVKRLSVEDRERPYYKKRRQLLEQLAYWLHTQPLEGTGGKGRAREVAEGDLKAQVAQFLLADPQLTLDKRTAWQEAEGFVAMAKARTGLLVERGDQVYNFAHLTFQEYLAAAYLKYEYAHSIDDLWQAIQPYLHHPAWREVILLLLGSLNEFRRHPTELVRRIFESTDEYEDVLHRHLFLAASALSDRVRVDASLYDVIVDRLLTIARSGELGCEDAIATLGTLQGDEQAAAGLLALARDTASARLRHVAVRALGRLGWAIQAAQLLQALIFDSTIEIGMQYNAIATMGQLGQINEVIDVLLNLARNNTVIAGVRHDTAQALARLGRMDEAVELLLDLACDDTISDLVRRAAVETLGKLGKLNGSVLSGLQALARNRTVGIGVRSAAAKTLGQLGRTSEASDILLILTQEDNVIAEVQIVAAQALGQLGRSEEATRLLLSLACDSAVTDLLRSVAIQVLGRLDWADETTLFRLRLLAQDSTVTAGVRGAAAQALGQLGWTGEAADLLLDLAQNERMDGRVRRAAAVALGQLGRTDEAASRLLALARDKRVATKVRNASVEALGRLGRTDDAVLSGLLALVQNKNVTLGVRSAAAQVLGQLGRTDEATQFFLTVVQNKNIDDFVRSTAAQVLGQLGHAREAILVVLLALAHDEDENWDIRSAAYNSLKALLWKDAG